LSSSGFLHREPLKLSVLDRRKGEEGRGKGGTPSLSALDVEGMAAAIEQAHLAAAVDEVPIGAAIVRDAIVIARTHNETVARRDPTAHAELLAIQHALHTIGSDRLTDCTLYVTLEPCAQCAGAIVLAKVGRLVYGASDPKAGMCGSVGDLVRHPRLNHRLEVIAGIDEPTCGRLLQEFFAARR
jgi:tRNA(adenine34) deaminase